MRNTKEVILSTALNLFNHQGLSKVTLRTIADTIGMSQGNLNYHFRKRDMIIESLYFRLVDRMDEHMTESDKKSLDLEFLFRMSSVIMESFFEYRFFMLDFVQIMRENSKIRKHYRELSKMREKQFSGLFKHLVDRDILRDEILPNEYLFLYKRIQILGDFWISSAATTESRLTKSIIDKYSNILNQAIFPYLTKKGRKEYYTLTQ